jgi:hypothetical protein
MCLLDVPDEPDRITVAEEPEAFVEAKGRRSFHLSGDSESPPLGWARRLTQREP